MFGKPTFLGRNLFVGQSSSVLYRHIFIKVSLNYIEALQAFDSSAVGIPTAWPAELDLSRMQPGSHWYSSNSFCREPVVLLLIGRKPALQYYIVDYPALMKVEYATESLYWHNKRY